MRLINLLLVFSLFLFACNSDECENLICINDGVCVDGTCECPPGFSGDVCEKIVEPRRMIIERIELAGFLPWDQDGVFYDDSDCIIGIKLEIDGSGLSYSSDPLGETCPNGEIVEIPIDNSLNIIPTETYFFNLYDVDDTNQTLMASQIFILREIGSDHDEILQITTENGYSVFNLYVTYQF